MAQLDVAAVEPHEEAARMVRVLEQGRAEEGDFIVFTIEVCLGERRWRLRRRYSEFAAFDKSRFAAYSQKSFLPPKRLGALKTQAFLEQRRAELESYLRTVVELELWLAKKKGLAGLPQPLATFLKFPEYEVHAMVELLSTQMSAKGEQWLATSHGETDPNGRKAFFQMHTYELHSVTRLLAAAASPPTDVAPLLDFLHRLPHLKVRGGSQDLPHSNIPINGLPFSLHFFKSLHTLWITDARPAMIQGLAGPRQSARFLSVLYSLNCLSEFLLQESLGGEPSESGAERSNRERCDSVSSADDEELAAEGAWPKAVEADFSFNQLHQLHSCITLLPRLQKLNLSNNRLTEIGFDLQHLTSLRHLDLSNNGLERLEAWHTRLGNLDSLILAGNSIRNVGGLGRLYSLQRLSLQDNAIVGSLEGEVGALGSLPCLTELGLRGNPLESGVDYRSRVLEVFAERAGEVALDGQRPSQRELDTVNVRLALRRAKAERERQAEAARAEMGAKLRSLAERTIGSISPEPRPVPANTCDCCRDQPSHS